MVGRGAKRGLVFIVAAGWGATGAVGGRGWGRSGGSGGRYGGEGGARVMWGVDSSVDNTKWGGVLVGCGCAEAIDKRKKDIQSAATGDDAKKRKTAKGAAAGAKRLGVISALEELHEIRSFATWQDLACAVHVSADAAHDVFSRPFAVRAAGDMLTMPGEKDFFADDITAKESSIQKEMKDFVEVFEAAKTSQGTRRGQVTFTNTATIDKFLEVLRGRFPPGCLILPVAAPGLPHVMIQNMQPACWSYAAKAEIVGIERALLATLRLGTAGTRTVILSRFSAIGDFVRQSIGQPNKPYSSAAVVNWLENASHSEVKQCIEAGYEMFRTTLTAKQIIYVPAASIVMDRVTAAGDVLGVKVSVMAPSDPMAAPDLKAGLADMGSAVNPVTAAAVKVLGSKDVMGLSESAFTAWLQCEGAPLLGAPLGSERGGGSGTAAEAPAVVAPPRVAPLMPVENVGKPDAADGEATLIATSGSAGGAAAASTASIAPAAEAPAVEAAAVDSAVVGEAKEEGTGDAPDDEAAIVEQVEDEVAPQVSEHESELREGAAADNPEQADKVKDDKADEQESAAPKEKLVAVEEKPAAEEAKVQAAAESSNDGNPGKGGSAAAPSEKSEVQPAVVDEKKPESKKGGAGGKGGKAAGKLGKKASGK